MSAKLIKTEQDYERALARIESLMDAKLNTPEGDELELLATLVELYEKDRFPVDSPDPVEAILFRMEQQGLRQQDLVPYIGSRSRVSEVLSRKRSLSLSMMRALHAGLGIPADVLLSRPGTQFPPEDMAVDCKQFPIREMVQRRWFPGFRGTVQDARERAEELVRQFLEPVGLGNARAALNRQHVRSGSQPDARALLAWRVRVLSIAQETQLPPYQRQTITKSFMEQLVHLSCLDEGPKLAVEMLTKSGVAVVTLRHLARTHLDGAAMWSRTGNPVAALTLRYDRLDSFWFTLCHELAHIAKHLPRLEDASFLDDLEASGDQTEDEADRLAREWLIPRRIWQQSQLAQRASVSADTVRKFAGSLRIHPAIVAGRVRCERGNYRLLTQLVGHGQVRRLFGDLDGAAA